MGPGGGGKVGQESGGWFGALGGLQENVKGPGCAVAVSGWGMEELGWVNWGAQCVSARAGEGLGDRGRKGVSRTGGLWGARVSSGGTPVTILCPGSSDHSNMEALGDAETPTSNTPASGTPTPGTPAPGTPISDTTSSDTPAPGTPAPGTPTRGSPMPDTPSDPAAGPGKGSGEATTPQGGEEAREAEADAGDTGREGKNTGGEGEDTGGSEGCAEGEAAGDGGAEAPRGAGGEAGDGGDDAQAGKAGGTGGGTGGGTEEGTGGEAAPAAADNTRRRQVRRGWKGGGDTSQGWRWWGGQLRYGWGQEQALLGHGESARARMTVPGTLCE